MFRFVSQIFRGICSGSIFREINRIFWCVIDSSFNYFFLPGLLVALLGIGRRNYRMDRSGDTAISTSERSAIFIGRRFAGKTTIFHAASKTASLPLRDADDGTSECETDNIILGTTMIKLIDTQGFRGDALSDITVLEKIKREVKQVGKISVFFIVTSFKRYDQEDSKVIDFVIDHLKPAAKASSYLIIMSCGDDERDRAIDQLVRSEEKGKKRFGRITDFPDERILNFDLPDIRSFPEAAVKNAFQVRYELARERVRNIIQNTTTALLLEEAISDGPTIYENMKRSCVIM